MRAKDAFGFIYSHASYSDNRYEKGVDCEWRIEADEALGVQLRFSQFHLEAEASCHYDYVEVFDGAAALSERLMGRFCSDEVCEEQEETYSCLPASSRALLQCCFVYTQTTRWRKRAS